MNTFTFLSLQHINTSLSFYCLLKWTRPNVNLYKEFEYLFICWQFISLIHSPNLHCSAICQMSTFRASTNLYWSLPRQLQRAVNPPREVLQLPTEEARWGMSPTGIGLGALFFQSSNTVWITFPSNCRSGACALKSQRVKAGRSQAWVASHRTKPAERNLMRFSESSRPKEELSRSLCSLSGGSTDDGISSQNLNLHKQPRVSYHK